LIELNRHAEEAVDIDQSWGAIGPFLLTELAERQGIGDCARASFEFYPVDPDRFWEPLLPARCREVERLASESTFLHLWSELYIRSAYDRSLAPPAGAFFRALIDRVETLPRFKGVYDEAALEAMIGRWVANREVLSPTAQTD
jgi:hypothetical protein